MAEAAFTNHASRAAPLLRYAGWWVVIACALVRCLVTPEPFPYWAIDPGRAALPVTGLTPAMSMAIDTLTLFACSAALLGEVLSGAALLMLPVSLWIIGCIGIAANALYLRAGTIDDIRIGATWTAAMAIGLTAMHLCRDDRLRRTTLAALIGIIAMLAAKGAIQYFYEHAMTVQRYRQDRSGFLESQGWLPDSTAARNFERRLNQPEATGWFGLSNVFATFAATCTIAFVGCAILSWREARVSRRLPDGWAGVLSLGALASIGAVILAGSKGGFTVTCIGLALLAGFMLLSRSGMPPLGTRGSKWGGTFAVGLIAAAIGAVILRGLIGERFGELSLLFRWYYMQGAVRIFSHYPFFGTGPDGFKDAYMLYKTPVSPEEVSSPHSIVFDFIGTLGIFGFAWAGLWIYWARRVGINLTRVTESPAAEASARSEGWYTALAISAAVVLATWFERALGSPEQAASRLAGFAAWIGLSMSLLSLFRVSRASLSIIAIAGLVGAIHCQIEVTPVWTGSACAIGLLLGACAAPRPASSARSASRRHFAAPTIMMGAAGVVAWMGVLPATRWESALSDGASRLSQLADIRTRLTDLLSGRRPARDGDSMGQLTQDLARLTDTYPAASDHELHRAILLLTKKSCADAARSLVVATQFAPRHFATVESLCRLDMELAATLAALGSGRAAADAAADALTHAQRLAAAHPSASAFGLIGNIESARAELTHEPDRMAAAIQAWKKASAMDPYGLSFPLRIFNAYNAAGRKEDAKTWAANLIELNELQRLDPLKRLADPDLLAARKALESK